jgi:hypothetical protein
MSYFQFLALNYNSSVAFDCGDVQDLLAFLAWTQFNNKASEVAIANGYAPLSNLFRKRYEHTRARELARSRTHT